MITGIFYSNNKIWENSLSCSQSSHFDGKMPYWYHKECFFQKQKPKALGDIAKLDSIRPVDLEYIKSRVGGSTNGSTTPQGMYFPPEKYKLNFC